MEIVLNALADWLHKFRKNRPVLTWLLIGLVFVSGCWLAYVEWANWVARP